MLDGVLPEEAGISPDSLRAVMAEFASGVTVVTATLQGVFHAMTATAFCSVSLDPPLVLVCVSKSSRFHAAVTAVDSWAVSLLAADQGGLARHFAHSGRDLLTQFAGVPHTLAPRSQAPLLSGSRGWLDCATYAKYDGGDHTIVVGEVLSASSEGSTGEPLTYHRTVYSDGAPR